METIWKIISTSAITGVFASILTTVLTVRYTRKNLKTTKYIETIITERIKWINLLRKDFSILITSVLVLQNNKEKLRDTQFDSERREYVNYLTMKDDYEDYELQKIHESKNLILDIDAALKKCLTPAKIVIKATQIKLRLDVERHNKLTKILDIIISEYSVIGIELKNSMVDINKMTDLAQDMLTLEWNDVIDKVERK